MILGSFLCVRVEKKDLFRDPQTAAALNLLTFISEAL